MVRDHFEKAIKNTAHDNGASPSLVAGGHEHYREKPDWGKVGDIEVDMERAWDRLQFLKSELEDIETALENHSKDFPKTPEGKIDWAAIGAAQGIERGAEENDEQYGQRVHEELKNNFSIRLDKNDPLYLYLKEEWNLGPKKKEIEAAQEKFEDLRGKKSIARGDIAQVETDGEIEIALVDAKPESPNMKVFREAAEGLTQKHEPVQVAKTGTTFSPVGAG